MSDIKLAASFDAFLPKPKAKVTSALSFDDPTVCQYCGKPLESTTVNGESVRVCWADRNVVPILPAKK